MLGIWALAAVACLLGALEPASNGLQTGLGAELVALLRVLCTAALGVALLLGPGIAWRAFGGRPIGLGFLAVPGLAVLAAVGGLTWLLAMDDGADARTVAFACCAPVLGLVLGALLAAGPEDLLEPEERRALGLTSLALGFAVARSLWSLSPADEFLGGTVSRTLISEGRPDSRISFHVVQLITNGAHANGTAVPQ